MSVDRLYTKGARVWVKDPSVVWKSAVITQDFDGSILHLQSENDASSLEIAVKSDSDLPPLRNPEILVGENDLTSLSYLHEPAVLHNLSVRFLDNRSIYTYCGIVLVAINPYEELHIYDSDTINMYRGKNMGDLDPHIYAVAEEAFTKMERDSRDQSIIVSGESGAGKTVSAKFAMRYFASVGGTSQTETQIEKKVLASSPIMEAIGNAKTTRNDNSSRFGKYIEISFNNNCHIIGANMRTYLLEKSRVVFQAQDERNYHIFYQMCAAKDSSEILKDLYLDDPENFCFLNQGENAYIEGVDDNKEFNATKEAFGLLQFSDNDQKRIFSILAAIMHLGNVDIKPGSRRADADTCKIDDDDESLKLVAKLLEVDEKELRKWLCLKKIITVRETLNSPMNTKDALFARNALAKCVYATLFDWIVARINRCLKSSSKVHRFIGVLDIYGFETFEVNSFEQFCINYANEKLQQQFNLHVFKLEQEEYVREDISWTMIDFYDNQPCIDLIETKLGILDLLNEECRVPKGSDESWVQKLYDKCSKSDHFIKPRLSQSAFIIKHFADDVEYESQGFLHKNRDTVHEEQIQILRESKNEFVRKLFSDKQDAKHGSKKVVQPKQQQSASAASKNKKTVGSLFHESLLSLMSTLNSTTPHYVRCIKPNDSKMAFQFDPKRAIQQLRACGVLETVRISAAGYPSRWTYMDFYLRYRALCKSKDIVRGDTRATCEKIVVNEIQDEGKYRFGKTKLFFRAGQVAYMEKLRSDQLRSCGIMIQKHVKGWLYRKRYLRQKEAAMTLQRYIRGYLARRKLYHLRRNAAAVLLQANIRRFIAQSKYNKLRRVAIGLQSLIRGTLARRRHRALLEHKKAVVIQKHVRGWLQRLKYKRALRNIILVQSLFRRHLAKKELKRLKVEAKSVEHQRQLNRGLENKIISLQQKLTESEKRRKELEVTQQQSVVAHQQEVESLKASNQNAKGALGRVKALEEELQRLQDELKEEKEDKVRMTESIDKERKEFASKEDGFKSKLQELEEQVAAKQHLQEQENRDQDIAELTRRFEAEKAAIHSEYAEERISYQRLLKEYNNLETQLEQLQETLYNSHERSMSTMSLVSSVVTAAEDESAYNSQSGRSSMRSSGPANQAEEINNNKGNTFSLDSRPKDNTDEESNNEQLIAELKEEISTLKRMCDEQQNVINKTVSQAGQSGNSTELCLQHEITRLTSENLDARERIENLNEIVRKLKKQLKAYVRKLQELGDSGALESVSEQTGSRGDNRLSNEVVIRKKEHDFMGMFEFKKEDEETVLRALIYDLKPQMARQMLPGLPSYILFMMIRYTDYINSEESLRSLIQSAIIMVKKVVKKKNDFEIHTLWLSNLVRFLNTLKQYSGDKGFQSENTTRQMEQALRNFDLSAYERLVTDICISMFQGIMRLIEDEIHPLLVPAVLEHEGVGCISAERSITRHRSSTTSSMGSEMNGSMDSHVDPKDAMDKLLRVLSRMNMLLSKHGLDPEIIAQIFRQVFYFICASSLNNLLLRKEMCHWSRAIEIRFNVSQLEQWARDERLQGESVDVISMLEPLVQATQLLQARKSDSDVQPICDMCSALKTNQIIKILNSYSPADDFEERVPPSFVRKVQERLQSRPPTPHLDQETLLMDVKFCHALLFPFNPSSIQLEELELPDFYNRLDTMLKKI